MTDAEALSCVKLKRIVKMLFRISSVITDEKAKSVSNGKKFYGLTIHVHDIDHTGPIERTVGVFDACMRFSASDKDAELVLTDADGIPAIVLPCRQLKKLEVVGRGKHRIFRIITEGATFILAA